MRDTNETQLPKGKRPLSQYGNVRALRNEQLIHSLERNPTDGGAPKEKQTLAGHTGGVYCVAYSPDGVTLASGSDDNTVILWDAASGKKKQTLRGHTATISSVVFSPDGATLASGSDDNTVVLWDAAARQKKQTLAGHTGAVLSVAFSQDGATLASGSRDQTVILWEAASGEKKQTLADHTDRVYSVAFSPDGATLASGSHDKTVILWDVASGQARQTLRGHSDGIRSAVFSPDGATLASGSKDKTVILWDVASGQAKQTLAGHTGGVTSVAFSPDGAKLVSASEDKRVVLWDPASGQTEQILAGHTGTVYTIAFSPDGATLMSGSGDKTVILWDVASGQKKQILLGHNQCVYSVAFSPDGATLASGSGDKTVILWDVASWQKKQTLAGHTGPVRSVAFSPDGATLASGSRDLTLILWDAASGQKKRIFRGHISCVNSVAFSPDGSTLASASSDSTLILWEAASGCKMRRLVGGTAEFCSVAFSPDGATLASGSRDKQVILWDVASGQKKQTLTGHTDGAIFVAFSPDGGTLAFGSPDKTLILWDVASGEKKQTLAGDTGYVWSIAFSPDGATLASGSGDNKVILWDATSGKSVSVHRPFQGRIASTSFDSGDGSSPTQPPEGDLHSGSSSAKHPLPDTNNSPTLTVAELESKVKLLKAVSHEARQLDRDQLSMQPANQFAAFSSLKVDPLSLDFGTTVPVAIVELRLLQLENLSAVLSQFPSSPLVPASSSLSSPREVTYTHSNALKQDHLRFRDILRTEVVGEWKGIQRLMDALPAQDRARLHQEKGERSLLARLKTALELNESVVDEYPLPAPGSGDSELWPWQQARERIRNFKKEKVVPLLTARRMRRQKQENIQADQTCGVEVDAQSLAELSELDATVDRLASQFQPAYEKLMSILRPGFPELRSMICEEIDKNCGMGKLRLDVMLSDFVLTPLPSTPSVAEAITSDTVPKAKGLKPKYMLKRFTSTQSDDFFREMEAMRLAESNGVHHPNVGEVEFGFEEGYGAMAAYFLAMPLYRCESRTWFKAQLESKNALAVVRAMLEMADGLNCLHHNGVIHGDIKPENVMFDVELPTGRPKFIDFNFSGVDQKTNALLKVKTAALGFSLGFVPPEFFDGSTERRTAESDVYSLGMTYAALLGVPDLSSCAPPAFLAAPEKIPTPDASLSFQALAPGAMGMPVYNSITKLCQLMTHMAPEKRLPLSNKSSASPSSGSFSVLEKLQELYDEVSTSAARKYQVSTDQRVE